MCGIVGFITNETKKWEIDRSKFLRQGLIIDTLRGDDSTGVFAVGHEELYKDDKSAFWLKKLGGGHEFVECADYYKSMYDTEDYFAAIGHNRAATVGGVDTSTAHPFQVGPITLVHNGTLTSTFGLPSPMRSITIKGKSIKVDSHAIAYNLAHHDTEEVLSKLNGAFALVWHDARDDTINVIRNSQRPLHMALSTQQDTLYMMSEAEMLFMLGRRLRLGLSNIYYPRPGQLLKYHKGSDLSKPEVKTIQLASDYYSGTYRGAHNYNRNRKQKKADKKASKGKKQGKDGESEGERRPLSPAPHLTDNTVFVGGYKREVPDLLQEALLEYDLMVEFRLPFVPQSKLRNKRSLTITGKLDGKYEAILYCQSQASGNLMDRTWTVRPVGVLERSSGGPLIVVKLVSTVLMRDILTTDKGEKGRPDEPEKKYIGGVLHERAPGTQVYHPVREEKGTAQRDDKGRGMLGYDNRRLPGPNGSTLTENEFRQWVSDGCMLCYCPITVEMAHDVIWPSNGEGVLCGDCDEAAYYQVFGGRRVH